MRVALLAPAGRCHNYTIWKQTDYFPNDWQFLIAMHFGKNCKQHPSKQMVIL